MRFEYAIGFAAALLGGCGEAGQPAMPDEFASEPVCSSGRLRSINESEGPEMGPGRACNNCHAESNLASGEQDAPNFAFAGTLYPTAHEPPDCIGEAAEGAEIEITDANGVVWTQLVNASGNFSDDGFGFKYPYRAKVRFQGREREMAASQSVGDCNSCHSEQGDEGAPGRILLP